MYFFQQLYQITNLLFDQLTAYSNLKNRLNPSCLLYIMRIIFFSFNRKIINNIHFPQGLFSYLNYLEIRSVCVCVCKQGLVDNNCVLNHTYTSPLPSKSNRRNFYYLIWPRHQLMFNCVSSYSYLF